MEHIGNSNDDGMLYHGNDLTELTKSELIHLIQDGSLSGGYSIHELYGITSIKGDFEKKYSIEKKR